jgi:hypothetical protein
MPGVKTKGWFDLGNASSNLGDAAERYMKGTGNDQDMLLQTVSNLSAIAFGLQESLQEFYERMERLHQKIDRMEKKVGSVPGSK